ncbi:hypothetical protein GEMRC1_002221 [Eukaryota sp. GEM-RC1]
MNALTEIFNKPGVGNQAIRLTSSLISLVGKKLVDLTVLARLCAYLITFVKNQNDFAKFNKSFLTKIETKLAMQHGVLYVFDVISVKLPSIEDADVAKPLSSWLESQLEVYRKFVIDDAKHWIDYLGNVKSQQRLNKLVQFLKLLQMLVTVMKPLRKFNQSFPISEL